MFSTISKNNFSFNETKHNDSSSYNDLRYQQLITNINHEVKTPLASLRLIAEGIEDGVFPVDKKICADIIEQVNRIDNTLNAIKKNNDLYYRQHECLIGQSTSEPAHCNAEQVLASVCEEFEAPMMEHGIAVKYVDNLKRNDNPNLKLASEDLRDSFNNILQNVLDHAVGATEVRVKCDPISYRDKQFFAVTFADNGCGTDASQDNMLSPFWCGDEAHTSASDNGKHNIGMGLAYVNDVVRSVGGSIRIDSSTGTGMTIMLVFPICAEENHAPQSLNVSGMCETFCFA